MASASTAPEAIVTRYLNRLGGGSADAVAELYAEDATVEDPVGGGEVHIGRKAIRGFYTRIENTQSDAEIFTLRVAGHEAAFFWALTVDHGESKMRIEIISVMTFDAEGKIASMKAYWGPENIKQL
jgi:steroid delta-isomerase